MSFLQDSVDLFTGTKASHMGAHQYAHHGGMCGGVSMSGAKLWAEAQAFRKNSDKAGHVNLVGAEERLLQVVSREIGDILPTGIRVIELGPGTIEAFNAKTLPILQGLQSSECTIVDESSAFLQKISTSASLADLKINAVQDDFFTGEHPYYNDNSDNLICMFGSIISNIINPLSNVLPEKALTESLHALSRATNEGWLLLGFDADQNGDRVRSYYKAHGLFQLNVFYRMAVDLPIGGEFDPKAFDYEADWRSASGQLAHIAVAKREMSFSIAGQPLSVSKGQRLHIKNSYKFSEEFFSHCCQQAGLDVIKIWSDTSSAKIFLLEKPSKITRTEVTATSAISMSY